MQERFLVKELPLSHGKVKFAWCSPEMAASIIASSPNKEDWKLKPSKDFGVYLIEDHAKDPDNCWYLVWLDNEENSQVYEKEMLTRMAYLATMLAESHGFFHGYDMSGKWGLRFKEWVFRTLGEFVMPDTNVEFHNGSFVEYITPQMKLVEVSLIENLTFRGHPRLIRVTGSKRRGETLVKVDKDYVNSTVLFGAAVMLMKTYMRSLLFGTILDKEEYIIPEKLKASLTMNIYRQILDACMA